MAKTIGSFSGRTAALIVLSIVAVISLVGAVIMTVMSGGDAKEQGSASGSAQTQSGTKAGDEGGEDEGTGAAGDGQQGKDPRFPKAAPVQPQQGREIIAQMVRRQADDPRALGKLDAPVTMVEFEDFSCPLCAAFQVETAPQLLKYVDQGILRIEFHDMAIFDANYFSHIGAAGARAAANQGKFWEYVRASFKMSGSSHPQWNEKLALKVAKTAGVPDLEKFNNDVVSRETQQAVLDESNLARSVGLQGTPSFFINDRFISGAQDISVFEDTIKAAAAAAADTGAAAKPEDGSGK